jgi:hypothetical protein
MAYTFFYISLAAVLLLFAISLYFKQIKLSNIIIGITAIAYSLIYEVSLGHIMGLYYYITPGQSMKYILISAILIYAPLNIIYTLFLPEGRKRVLIYTSLWIVAMLLFEYLSVAVRTVVFTGWRPVPWSLVTYIVTYCWIIYFFRLLEGKVVKKTPKHI